MWPKWRAIRTIDETYPKKYTVHIEFNGKVKNRTLMSVKHAAAALLVGNKSRSTVASSGKPKSSTPSPPERDRKVKFR